MIRYVLNHELDICPSCMLNYLTQHIGSRQVDTTESRATQHHSIHIRLLGQLLEELIFQDCG